MALKSYPEAKARFLKGLPDKQSFFIIMRIYNKAKQFEQIFVHVKEIKGGKIKGMIASRIIQIKSYKLNDPIECEEKDIFDWLITKPDGSEEGNFIGKFIDAFQERYVQVEVSATIVNGKALSTKFENARNNAKQDISYCFTDAQRKEAEVFIKKSTSNLEDHKLKKSPKKIAKFFYMIYYDIQTQTFMKKIKK